MPKLPVSLAVLAVFIAVTTPGMSNKAAGATYGKVGVDTVLSGETTTANRCAQPVVMPEDGTIVSLSVYHKAGAGRMLLAVYANDQSTDLPADRLAVTPATSVNSTEGWQTTQLLEGVPVQPNQRIWLAWVYENNPGIPYEEGLPGRAISADLWDQAMPAAFGESFFAQYHYSIYATYVSNDTSPPVPDPMEWETEPYATGARSVAMVAQPADDLNGVQYYFAETSGNPGGDDSGWRDSRFYTDAGLLPTTAYSYTVKARDKSLAANETATANVASVVTLEDIGDQLREDLNADCRVGMDDLAILAEQWLDEAGCADHPAECADIDRAEGVNGIDYAMLANKWLWRCPATVVINEFMADNKTTIEDPDQPGAHPDWIEIYNYGLMPVALGDMYLTDDLDDPRGWPIPDDVVIGVGEHLLFWADKDPEEGSLHTDFGLNDSGEAIGLADADGVFIDSVSFGPQQEDISRGRFPDVIGDWVSMEEPTPGKPNKVGMAPAPRFSRPGGTFAASFSLWLSSESSDANIYYTTDGSMPDDTKTLYTGPVSIIQTTWIRALVYEPDLSPGPVESRVYLKLDSDVDDFESNLPIVVIDSFGRNIDNSNRDFHPVLMAFIDVDEDTGRARIDGRTNFAGYGAMHIRGASTAGYAKKQYRMEVRDENEEDKAVSLLGMPSESDWILHAPYSDKTLMRNYMVYDSWWRRKIGRSGLRTRFVEVFTDFDGNGRIEWDTGRDGTSTDYRGVYVLMENIKQGRNRVDIAKLGPDDNAEPEISGGYIFKHDWHDAPTFTTSIYRDRLVYVDPEYDWMAGAQRQWIKGYCDDFEAALSSSYFANPVNGYAKYIDVGTFIDNQIMVEISRNVDGYVLSTYFYKDRGGKITMGPVWDYNGSLGGADYFQSHRTDGWHYENPEFPADNTESWRWFERLMDDPEYRLRLADRWFDLREDKFAATGLLEEIEDNTLLLTDGGATDNAVNRNFARWDILQDNLWPNYYDNSSSRRNGAVHADYVDWLKTWLSGRLLWMDRAIAEEFGPRPPAFSHDGGQVDTQFALKMTIAGGGQSSLTLIEKGSLWYYKDDGSDQGTRWRTEDISWPSGHAELGYGDGDERTELSFGTDKDRKFVTTYFRHTFNVENAADVLSLTLSLLRDDGAVVYINDKEVERPNMHLGEIDYLTHADDAIDRPEEQTFYSYTVDPALLVNSENIIAVEIHQANFTSSDISFDLELKATVSNAGGGPGTIYYTTDGSDPRLHGGGISDKAFKYTSEIALDKSTQFKARTKNGDEWSALNEATFVVGPIAESLRITEIMYHPASDPNSEFIELQNIGSEVINLNMVEFVNGMDFVFGDVLLEPGEHVVVVRDKTAFEAARGVGIRIAGEFTGGISNGGERLVLVDAIGRVIHDFKYDDKWYPISDGKGFSLNVINPAEPDLSKWNDKDNWQAGNIAGGTPGASHVANAVGNSAVVINEVLTHTDDLEYGDWIELHNTADEAIDIGAWFISDDMDNLQKYEIQTSDPRAVVPAGGYVVFSGRKDFRNPSDPGSKVQFGLSELGEKVYLSSGAGDGLAGGYSVARDFAASANGVTTGRHVKSEASGYDVDFVPMAHPTKERANSLPGVGPVVINEIMYNPYPNSDETAEYIQLKNISPQVVSLYDPAHPENTWKFTDGIEFTFPMGIELAPTETVFVVRGNPMVFRETYDIAADVKIFGPFASGSRLADAGETVEISMPGQPEAGAGYVPYLRVDLVNYSDGRHHDDYPNAGGDPWPRDADGKGQALGRILGSRYGNDPANWQAVEPDTRN